MPVIDITGRSLHYLYSSWLSVTPFMFDTIPTKNGRELMEKWVSELMTNL